ncbi:MAG: undecaprenyl diphosphate synthase family protein [Acidimicrobiales bacterium]
MTTVPHSRRGPVPSHVAWVSRRADGGPEAPEREERALRALVDSALDLGVARLTVQEPSGGRALRARAAELARRGVAVMPAVTAGNRDAGSTADLVGLEAPALRVVLAGEGSGRRELVGALRELASRGVAPKKVRESTISDALGVPDVDLLVLTGDDRRVPDLLLWQVAYSEIVVLHDPWPEVSEGQFRAAVDEYQRRDRRYGGLVAPR